jgi:hypothetical protein
MIDKILIKFFGLIDDLNEKISNLLTFKLCSCKKKNAKKKNLE